MNTLRVDVSDKAFILAAGFGSRLRPLTLECPKPLVKVGGQCLVDHTIEHFQEAEIYDYVVNTHYLAEKMATHLHDHYGERVTILNEPNILHTGGGIKNGLEHFGDKAFFVTSGDGFWSNGPTGNVFARMSLAWNPNVMDILMLLQRLDTMTLTRGSGDYDVDEAGNAKRSLDKTGLYMFASIRLNHPRIFEDTQNGPFNYLDLMDRAESKGRLYGLVHDGDWHHISTPQDLEAVRQRIVV